MNSKWVALALVFVAALSLLRIISQWRRHSNQPQSDWDEQFIVQLRKAGVNPFEEHTVDFFFTLTTEPSGRAIAEALAADGFEWVGQTPVDGGQHSLQLRRRMRLIVPEMQALTQQLGALAEAQGASYDQWAVARTPALPG
jgi:5-formyltetrahydrofolate cyclo-ligase